MNNKSRSKPLDSANQQGAAALLAATFSFLLRNNISKESIFDCLRQHHERQKDHVGARKYRRLVRAYEDMGIVMSAWYSLPKFLDKESRPLPLKAGRGPLSIAGLVRASRVRISSAVAVELMRRSPSVRVDDKVNFTALRRAFVLPDFEIPRAALVIERYLDTLRINSSARKNGTTLLLERNCHVPDMSLGRIAPVLRDIRGRGMAFIDSVDGDIESHRIRRFRRKGVGELGVLVFAWTRSSKPRRSKSNAKNSAEYK
jgi:hypothetical protein